MIVMHGSKKSSLRLMTNTRFTRFPGVFIPYKTGLQTIELETTNRKSGEPLIDDIDEKRHKRGAAGEKSISVIRLRERESASCPTGFICADLSSLILMNCLQAFGVVLCSVICALRKKEMISTKKPPKKHYLRYSCIHIYPLSQNHENNKSDFTRAPMCFIPGWCLDEWVRKLSKAVDLVNYFLFSLKFYVFFRQSSFGIFLHYHEQRVKQN